MSDLEYYKQVLGEELGIVFSHTLIDWTKAKTLRERYDKLFNADQRLVELMNKADLGFFASVQVAYWESCTMAICRLSDPATQGRPPAVKKNISVFALAELGRTAEQKDQFSALLKNVTDECAPHRDWRNLRYAHQDYDSRFGPVEPLKPVELEKMDRALQSIYSVLAYIHQEWFSSFLGESIIQPALDIQFLIYDAIKYRDIRIEEAKKDFQKALNWYPDWLYRK
jgi:tetratricopeptide (TPR) repeat protein